MDSQITNMDTQTAAAAEIERHPWPPFIPRDAKILIMGTFPPGEHRWSMNFFYPNPINDFWRIIGLLFNNDKDSLYIGEIKTFDLEKIKNILNRAGIAMGDTGLEVRRLKGNASDKFLEIVTPMPLVATLEANPTISAIATTGEKAATVVSELTGTPLPKMGESVTTEAAGRQIRIYRMPSSSRAYPLALDKKAAYYRQMFENEGILPSKAN